MRNLKRSPPGELVNRNTWGLTLRQCDVLRYLLDGESNKEIAAHVGMAEGTVKARVCELLTHFKVTTRAMLIVAVADELKLPRVSTLIPRGVPSTPPRRRRAVQPYRRRA
jgi:DNA-binding NarL/FixJ family response regulator